MKYVRVWALLLAVMIVLSGCNGGTAGVNGVPFEESQEIDQSTTTAHKHTWMASTCDTPKTCEVCSETEGEALGHEWVDDDYAGKKCWRCHITECDINGHDWTTASHFVQSTCRKCNQRTGEEIDLSNYGFADIKSPELWVEIEGYNLNEGYIYYQQERSNAFGDCYYNEYFFEVRIEANGDYEHVNNAFTYLQRSNDVLRYQNSRGGTYSKVIVERVVYKGYLIIKTDRGWFIPADFVDWERPFEQRDGNTCIYLKQ